MIFLRRPSSPRLRTLAAVGLGLAAASASAEPDCRLDGSAMSNGARQSCMRAWAGHVLGELGETPDAAPATFYASVLGWAEHDGKRTRRALRRASGLLPDVRRQVTAAGLPGVLAYLPVVESEYKPAAMGRRAAGLWQIVPGTARAYGLTVDERRDERLDPERSTAAAVRYLRDLSEKFDDDWLLVLAAYNRGESAVRRGLRAIDEPAADGTGSLRSPYWELADERLVPRVTRDYVSRFVAAAAAAESSGVATASRR